MNDLPLDILASILGSLNFDSLRECSLVSRRLHLETQPLLFSHLQLNHWTWKAKCQFLLRPENSNRRKMIKKLSILLVYLPIREEHNVPANLTEILVKLGPQIETLSIDGYYEGGGLGDPDGTPWSDLSLAFRDALSQHVMPSVQSLQLKEVGHFPLFTVLKNCPLLRNLTIGANWIFSTEDYAGDRESSGSLPDIISLTLHPFLPSDITEAGSLSQFIKFRGGKFKSLRLVSSYHCFTPASLAILIPFVDMKTHLQHLTFDDGMNLPISWTKYICKHGLLTLDEFPKLQTVTLPIGIPLPPEDWNMWFQWIVRVASSSEFSFPATLSAVRFIIFLKGNYVGA